MRFDATLAGLLCLCAAAALAQDDNEPLASLATITMDEATLASRGLSRAPLGEVPLPSGRLVAVDPLVAAGISAQALRVPPGTYRLDRIFPADDQTRTALAILNTAACTPVLWQPAVPDGASLGDLKPGEIFGFGVDAGTGSMADMQFWESFGAPVNGRLPGEDFFDYSQDTIFALMFPDQSGIPHDFIVSRGAAALAVYSAGYGDGFYGNYWGFSAKGCPCAFVTDFAVLEDGAAWDFTREAAMAPPPDMTGLRLSLDPAQTGSFAACADPG